MALLEVIDRTLDRDALLDMGKLVMRGELSGPPSNGIVAVFTSSVSTCQRDHQPLHHVRIRLPCQWQGATKHRFTSIMDNILSILTRACSPSRL